jgi:hypothetical protein
MVHHENHVGYHAPHVLLCILLEAGQRGKKDDFGKESMHEESDSWKEE